MVAFELEVLALKTDRFGWDRDRGTPLHDRLVKDWMDALQDYPLSEVQEGCRRAHETLKGKMPNEVHVRDAIRDIRREKAEAFKSANPTPPEPERKPVDRETAAEILRKAGFNPQRMPKGMQA